MWDDADMDTEDLTGALALSWDDDGRLYADECDPRVVLDEEFLLSAWRGEKPGVTLTLGGTGAVGTTTGSVLRITAVNRLVIYVINGRSPYPELPGYIAGWPD